jgi:predicted nuclease with TOPRIM domain
MDSTIAERLEIAKQERADVMGEFLRLKAELTRTQKCNDDLRSENSALLESLNSAEHVAQNLMTYANEIKK